MKVTVNSFNRWQLDIEKISIITDVIPMQKGSQYALVGDISNLSDIEINKIEQFEEILEEINCYKKLYDLTNEIDLNLINISRKGQVKRYLSYILEKVEGLIDLVNYKTFFEVYKQSVVDFTKDVREDFYLEDGTFGGVSVTLVHTDPISRILYKINQLITDLKSAKAFIQNKLIENGFEKQELSQSNLIFKGLPGDFAELTCALYNYGSIQKITGEKLFKNEFQLALKKLFNLDNDPSFTDQNLSKRLSERKQGTKGFLVGLQNALDKNETK